MSFLAITNATRGTVGETASAVTDPNSGAGPVDATLLPQPSTAAFGSDVGSELAKLALDADESQRRAAEQSRATEEKAQEAAEDAQINALREKASDALTAGVISGASTMASGAISIGGSVEMGGAKGDKAADIASKKFEGISKVVDGAGKIVSAGFQKASDEDSADATSDEQIAGRHKSAAGDAHDDADAADKDIDRVLDFYKEYTSAKADEAKAAMLRA